MIAKVGRATATATNAVAITWKRNYSRRAVDTARSSAAAGKQLRRAFRKFLLAAHPDILRGVDSKRAEHNEQSLQTLNAIVDAALGQGSEAGGTKIAHGKYTLDFWCLERSEGDEELRRVKFIAKVPLDERLRMPFAVKAVETLAKKAGVEESKRDVEDDDERGHEEGNRKERRRELRNEKDPEDILAMLRKGVHMAPAAMTEAALFQAIRNHQRDELEREKDRDIEEELLNMLQERLPSARVTLSNAEVQDIAARAEELEKEIKQREQERVDFLEEFFLMRVFLARHGGGGHGGIGHLGEPDATADAAAFAAMLASAKTFSALRLREDFENVWARTAFVLGAEDYDVELGEEGGGAIVVKIPVGFREEEAVEYIEMVAKLAKSTGL